MHDTVELLARKDTDTMTDESMPHGSLDVAQSEQNQSEKTLPSNQANTTHRSDGDEDREVHDAESAPEEQASAAAESPAPAKEHPRKDLADWKWKCTIFVIFMTSFINGYDVSNVANIQPRLYEAFGNIKLLPWIGLSYSLSFFALLSLSRKIILCFNLRWIFLCMLPVFVAGAAVSGAASSLSVVIGGRIIMGLAGCLIQTSGMLYMSILATPAEMPKLFAGSSSSWAAGLIAGGPIGEAFANNHHTTWRWAFYLNLPLVGLCIVLSVLCLPKRSFALPVPLMQRLTRIDPVGVVMNMVVPVLLAVALTFDGPIWKWDSGASIAVWVVFAVTLIFWGVQQYFSLFTKPAERALPVHIMSRTDLIPIWIATGCGGATYAITLYYTPLFFSFARGFGAVAQTIRLFPFIFVFIVVIMTTGSLLPAVGRYSLIYILGGAITLAGGAAMAATMSSTVSDAQVMGLEALIGIGLGLHFQHGMGITTVINKNERDRVDSVLIGNMTQMGSIAIMLAAAGSIFQNVGYDLLVDAVGHQFESSEIRSALAGVSSVVWASKDPEVVRRGVKAVAEVIAREFWIVASSGAVCLICGLLMKREKLDYGRKPPSKPQERKQDSSESA